MDKIYLGFAGKENLRLGESLILIKKTFDILRPLVFSLNEEKLYGYLSNAYLMYSLDKIEKLNSILYLSLDRKFYILETSNYTSKRANLLAMKNNVDGEYCINFKLFSFLSERLWPAIINAFINSLSRNDNYFYFQSKFPYLLNYYLFLHIFHLLKNECLYHINKLLYYHRCLKNVFLFFFANFLFLSYNHLTNSFPHIYCKIWWHIIMFFVSSSTLNGSCTI